MVSDLKFSYAELDSETLRITISEGRFTIDIKPFKGGNRDDVFAYVEKIRNALFDVDTLYGKTYDAINDVFGLNQSTADGATSGEGSATNEQV